jgi:amidase
VTIRSTLSLLLLAAVPMHVYGAEQWVVATDLWGNNSYQTLQLDVQEVV